jgi:putative motility protein YjfB-like
MMDMDLVNSFSGLQQAQTMSNIQTAVAVKVMDSQKMEGAGVLQLLNAATGGATPGDPLVAAATGLGGQIDTYG